MVLSHCKLRTLLIIILTTSTRIGSLQQEKCKLENDFERQLEYHARADCKQLTNMMHTKLPQELKEVIYQYLYLEDVPVPVGSYHFTTYVPEPLRSNNTNPPAHSKPFIVVPEGAETQDHSVERDDSIIYPDSRLLDPAYVGYDVARDASKYYYKNNTFSVCTLENAISDFLFRDPIHNFTTQGGIPKGTEILNIIPIDYIRNLQIRIKYEHFGAYFTFYNNLRQGEKDLIQGIYDILYNLSHCISSPSAAALHVEFCMMTAYSMELAAEDDYVERHHMNLLEAIRVPVYMLKHDLKADIKVIHYDEHCMPFPKDCTAIFQLPEAEWLRVSNLAGVQYDRYRESKCYA